MSEKLRESLSALMDNEATELELRRVLKQAKDDPDLLDHWQRYHLVRDVIHQQASAPAPDSLLAGIREAINEEALPATETALVAKRTPSLMRGFSRALGQGGIAASVALVVLFTAHTLNQPADNTASSTDRVAAGAQGGGSAQLTALSASNDFVETQFSRSVSFQGESENSESLLDSQSRDRLRQAIHREFEQSVGIPMTPVFYLEPLPE